MNFSRTEVLATIAGASLTIVMGMAADTLQKRNAENAKQLIECQQTIKSLGISEDMFQQMTASTNEQCIGSSCAKTCKQKADSLTALKQAFINGKNFAVHSMQKASTSAQKTIK